MDRDPERYSEYLKTNGLAAISLVKWAEKVNPKIRFVFASTQRIYNIEGKQEVKVWVDIVLTMLDRNQGYDTLFFQEPQYEKKLEDFSSEILQNVPIPEGVHPYELFKFLIWDVIVQHTPMDNGKVVFIGDNFGRLDLEGNQRKGQSVNFSCRW